jgi:hypothetical protein
MWNFGQTKLYMMLWLTVLAEHFDLGGVSAEFRTKAITRFTSRTSLLAFTLRSEPVW